MKINANKFAVTRHTKESKYSYFDGTWEELIELVNVCINDGKTRVGYRNEVVLVNVPAERFFTSTIQITKDMKLSATFAARREGETSYVQITGEGAKTPAKFVDIILYHKSILENDLTFQDSDFEIISINARLGEEEEPIDPMTMARNFLVLTGGTKGEYTAEQFAKSIIYWSDKTKCFDNK